MLSFILNFLFVVALLIFIKYGIIFVYKFTRNPPEKLNWSKYDELTIACSIAYMLTYFTI